jgi:hypothetical protein
VLWLLLIALLSPLCNRLAVENEDVEERVHQQNAVGSDADHIDDVLRHIPTHLLESSRTGVGGPLNE